MPERTRDELEDDAGRLANTDGGRQVGVPQGSGDTESGAAPELRETAYGAGAETSEEIYGDDEAARPDAPSASGYGARAPAHRQGGGVKQDRETGRSDIR